MAIPGRRIEPEGTLALATTVTYHTWGRPTLAFHNGTPDTDFRRLYLGRIDVWWDDAFGAGPTYIHTPRPDVQPSDASCGRSRSQMTADLDSSDRHRREGPGGIRDTDTSVWDRF